MAQHGRIVRISLKRLAIAAFLSASLSACVDMPVGGTPPLAPDIITAGQFRIAMWSRIADTGRPVTIYVGGDVRGWMPAGGGTVDDAPDEGMSLRLAEIDPAINVVYIAHPCEAGNEDISCLSPAWGEGVVAEQIIESMSRAVDHAVISFPHPRINLVGYSGGGAIAVLIASRRHDIASLRTIAGNLDPDSETRLHGANPPEDFIDPMNVAPRLSAVPQLHYAGALDALIPPFIIENFVKNTGGYCTHVAVVANATHKSGWEQVWATDAARIPSCDSLNSPE